MEQAIVLSNDDIKKILADYFGIDEKKVVKSQHTWTVKGINAEGCKNE